MKRILTINDRRQTLRMLPFRVEGSILRMRSTADARRAFTLIEMMAALALAMILLYILFQIFTTVGRAMTISNARSEIHANARAILRIMHQEISGAFLDTSQDADDDDNDGDPSSTTDPDDEVGNYFVIVDGTPGDRALFLSSSAIGMNSSLSEVAYWLDSSDPNKPILRRNMELLGFDTGTITGSGSNTLSDINKSWDTDDWANRIVIAAGQTRRVVSNTDTQLTVDPAWSPQPGVDEGYTITAVDSYDTTYATILGENVLAFNVEYYDAATDTFASGDYTATEKRLTTAVRITLRVQDSRGRLSEGEEFVEIIAIKGRE